MRTALGAAALLTAIGVLPHATFAQSKEPPPKEQAPKAQPPKEAPRPGEPGQPGSKPPVVDKGDKAEKGDEKADATPPGEAAKRKSSLDRMPQTAEEKARALADLYAHLATADDEAQAKRYADRIERIWLVSGSDTVNLLMQRAAKAIEEKRPEQARKFLDLVIELAPDFAEGFNRRAYLHFTENDYQAAVGDLRRVLALDPNHFKALEGLARIWSETGDKKGAFRVMKQLMDVHPHAPGAKATFDELKREVDGQGI